MKFQISSSFLLVFFLFLIIPNKGITAPLSIDSVTVTDVSCYGYADGTITVAISGGIAPYTYTWSGPNFQISSDTVFTITNLSKGTYWIVVEGPPGETTFQFNIIVGEPDPLSLTANITDIDCFGDTDGAINITVTDGTFPYGYNWTDGTGTGSDPASEDQSGLSAGTFLLTVTDDNSCTLDTTLTVSGPAASLSGSIVSQTQVACFGEATGSVTVSGAGGTPGYMYSLDGAPFQASGTFPNLTANNYTVTVRDANFCTHDVDVTITQPATALSGSITGQTNVACFGGATGSVTVAGAGGTPGYMYSLDGAPFQASGTFPGLTATNYTVTVRDANLCTTNVPVTITEPATAVSGSITGQTNVACLGEATGSVTVAGAGGTPGYMYSLDGAPFQPSGTFPGLTATNYTVTVRDANLCTTNVPVTITEPATAVTGSITGQIDVACFGEATGSVTVTGAGGIPGYMYSLDGPPFQPSGIFPNLTANNYTVTVRDANLCTFDVPVTITQPATALSGGITGQTVACFGQATASVTVAGSGGTPVYEYSLDGAPYQASGTYNNLAANTYIVTVRDANLCTTNVTVTITEAATALSGSIISQTNVACIGGSTGSVTVAGSGGAPAYEYSFDGAPYQSSGTFGNLAASNYTVTVRDANLCTTDVPVTITEPATAVSGSITGQTNVACLGEATGSVTVAGAGGTPGYIYSLDGAPFQPSGTFPGLSATNYTVTVRDANLCTTNVPVTITEPATAVTGSITGQTQVTCFGEATGSVTVTGAGGMPGYQYSLDGAPFQPSGTFPNLTANNYTVTVRDANLCTTNVPVTITQPASALSGGVTGQTVACFGQATASVTVAGSGGTPVYEYSLDGAPYQASGTYNNLAANTYIVTVRDANLCTTNVPVTITEAATALSGSITSQTDIDCIGGSTGSVTVAGSGGAPAYEYSLGGAPYQSSGTFGNLAANNYTVTVRDANLCTTDVPVTITEPATAVTGSITVQTNVACLGEATGSVTVAGAGGTPGYIYSLDGAPFQPSGTFPGLSATNYTVTVRDANLCTTNVPVTITEPATAVTGSITGQTQVTCFGEATGSVTVTGAGGMPGYQYSLDGAPFQPSGTFPNLTADNYTVTVRDANLCTFDVPVTITQPASALSGGVTGQTVACFGQATASVTVAGSGGIPGYMYSLDSAPYQASGTYNNLAANTYTVTVRDANLCTTNVPVTITEAATALSGSITSQTGVACFGDTTGIATIAGSGGFPPYEYSLDGGAYQLSGIFGNLAANNYMVTVRDANLCTTNVPVTITGPATAVSGSITSLTDVTCSGGAAGSATIAGSGGTAPYEYSLDGGAYQGSGTFNGLAANNYTITVRDGNLCTFNIPLVISEPSALTVTDESITHITCNGADDGSISVTASGGLGSYTYTLSPGTVSNATGTFTTLPPGIYSVSIVDSAGCGPVNSNNLTINEPSPVTIDNEIIVDISCNGYNDGTVEIRASGGTAPYTYSIDGGLSYFDNGGIFTGLAANFYPVAARDSNLCVITGNTVPVSEPDPITFTADTTRATCNETTSDGAIIIHSDGGIAPYQYSIDGGTVFQSDSIFTNLFTGNYNAVIEDDNGCQLAGGILVDAKITVTADAGKDTIICPGVSLTLSAGGGDTYLWTGSGSIDDPASPNPVVSPIQATSYILTAYRNVCSDEDTVLVSMFSVPGIDAGNDTTIQGGTSVILTASSGFVSYFWQPSDFLSSTNDVSVTSTPEYDILYYVTGTTADGCLETDSVNIYLARKVIIPSGFTPNNDGVNDMWEITWAELYPDMTVDIFTRWGAKVFHSKGYTSDKFWDGTNNGKELPIGTYYFIIQVNDGFGTKPITGPITIIR